MSKRISAKRREQMEAAFDKQVATMRRNEAAKPYPTPWVWNTYQRVNGNRHPITGAPINESGFYIVCPPGFDIAYLPITSSVNGEIQGANVRKIVKAVNAYDEIVKTLSALVAANNCNYDRDAMRSEGLFERAASLLASLEPENAAVASR